MRYTATDTGAGMKPFRKNLAIAIDGGGIRGVIVTQAMSMLEKQIDKPLHESARLYAGTSTGSIISAHGSGSAHQGYEHLQLKANIFRRAADISFPRLATATRGAISAARAIGDMKMKAWERMSLRTCDHGLRRPHK
jgi:hypothetical protein